MARTTGSAAPDADFDPRALATRGAPSARARDLVVAEVGFEVDPRLMYPAMLDFLRAAADGDRPYPPEVARHVAQAAAAPADAWDLARRDGDPDDLTGHQRAARAALLEVARLAFTALLKHREGRAIGVRILDRPRWRL